MNPWVLPMEKEGPTQEDYAALDSRVANGAITKATKAELEDYAAMLCHPNRFQFHQNLKSQLEETIRTLLIVRMSEEANKEAIRISMQAADRSTAALYIAWAALVLAVVQTLAALLALLR